MSLKQNPGIYMKALLKLIFLGLVAGAAWKYLDENNISVSAKLSEAKEWVIGQIDEIKAASETAPAVTENSSPEPAWSPSESRVRRQHGSIRGIFRELQRIRQQNNHQESNPG